jgi:ferric iron reductase protein FhuF
MKIVMLKETKTFKTLLRAYKEFRESNSSLHTMQVDVDDIISLVSKLYSHQMTLPNIFAKHSTLNLGLSSLESKQEKMTSQHLCIEF